MKPPGTTVHFTQTETTKSKRCSCESFKIQLKVLWKQVQKQLEYFQETSSQFQIATFQGGDSCSLAKCLWMPCRKRETAYKAKIKCPKEPAWRTEMYFRSKIWSWAFVRSMRELNWRCGIFPFVVAALWFAHTLTPGGQETLEGTLSCQGAAVMLRGWKALPGTAELFCPCHRQQAPLHLQPTCLFSKAISSHKRREWIWQGWHFPSKPIFWWERAGGISRGTANSCPRKRDVTYTVSPKTCEARRELQVRLCSQQMLFEFIYLFIAVPFTEICRIV